MTDIPDEPMGRIMRAAGFTSVPAPPVEAVASAQANAAYYLVDMFDEFARRATRKFNETGESVLILRLADGVIFEIDPENIIDGDFRIDISSLGGEFPRVSFEMVIAGLDLVKEIRCKSIASVAMREKPFADVYREEPTRRHHDHLIGEHRRSYKAGGPGRKRR